MFIDSIAGSMMVIIGKSCSNPMGALAGWFGSLSGALTAYYFLAVPDTVSARIGLFGYNGSGAMAALSGGIFHSANLETFLIGLVAAGFSSLMVSFFRSLLTPLPVLTFPFITTAWIFLLTRAAYFSPVSQHQKLNLYNFILSLYKKLCFAVHSVLVQDDDNYFTDVDNKDDDNLLDAKNHGI